MSRYDNYINLIQYKLDTCNFVDEAINILSQQLDIPIDVDTLMRLLLKIINIDNTSQSECVCEPGFDSQIVMPQIIHELLNTIVVGSDPSDPTMFEDLCDFESINNVLQMLKRINMEIIIQEELGVD